MMADWAGTAKNRRRNALLLAKCFGGFKSYKKEKKAKQRVNFCFITRSLIHYYRRLEWLR